MEVNLENILSRDCSSLSRDDLESSSIRRRRPCCGCRGRSRVKAGAGREGRAEGPRQGPSRPPQVCADGAAAPVGAGARRAATRAAGADSGSAELRRWRRRWRWRRRRGTSGSGIGCGAPRRQAPAARAAARPGTAQSGRVLPVTRRCPRPSRPLPPSPGCAASAGTRLRAPRRLHPRGRSSPSLSARTP